MVANCFPLRPELPHSGETNRPFWLLPRSTLACLCAVEWKTYLEKPKGWAAGTGQESIKVENWQHCIPTHVLHWHGGNMVQHLPDLRVWEEGWKLVSVILSTPIPEPQTKANMEHLLTKIKVQKLLEQTRSWNSTLSRMRWTCWSIGLGIQKFQLSFSRGSLWSCCLNTRDRWAYVNTAKGKYCCSLKSLARKLPLRN